MRKAISVMVIALTFVFGVSVGTLAAKKKPKVTADAWQGATPDEAASRLLELAKELAGKGSWENIYLGRAHYLAGRKEQAETIFARYSQGKAKPGDLIRIGRVYAHAGDWAKAKPVLDQVVERASEDGDWLVEVGAFYNLNGDRAHAEELFARGFKLEPGSLNNTLNAAGSYLGIAPRKR